VKLGPKGLWSEETRRRNSEEANAREDELEVVIDPEGTASRRKSKTLGDGNSSG
jgi:hypothetical protein